MARDGRAVASGHAGTRYYYAEPAGAAPGNRTVTFAYRARVAPGEPFLWKPLASPDGPLDTGLIVYVPTGWRVEASFASDLTLPSTGDNQGLTIYVYTGNATRPIGNDFAVALAPPVAVSAPPPAARTSWTDALGWLPYAVAAALVVVAAGWWAVGRMRAPTRSRGTEEARLRYAASVAALRELDRLRNERAVGEPAYLRVRRELEAEALRALAAGGEDPAAPEKPQAPPRSEDDPQEGGDVRRP